MENHHQNKVLRFFLIMLEKHQIPVFKKCTENNHQMGFCLFFQGDNRDTKWGNLEDIYQIHHALIIYQFESICQYVNIRMYHILILMPTITHTYIYLYMVEVIVTSKGQSSINDLANQPAAEAFPSEKEPPQLRGQTLRGQQKS